MKSKSLRHFGFISASALLASVVLGYPTTANAVPPKKFDEAGYRDCMNAADELFLGGKINSKTHAELYGGCCITAGGTIGPPPEKQCIKTAAILGEESTLPDQTFTPDLPREVPPGDIQPFVPAP
jgi:hypothetical protein